MKLFAIFFFFLQPFVVWTNFEAESVSVISQQIDEIKRSGKRKHFVGKNLLAIKIEDGIQEIKTKQNNWKRQVFQNVSAFTINYRQLSSHHTPDFL